MVYGINTGFGKLAQTIIPHERLAELQRNLVLSHSAGTGEPLAAGVVRLVLATKAVSLARGHSGVRPEIVDALLALCNAGLLPRIPSKGSVGASGDLAPLAHLACVLIGEGEVTTPDGEVIGGAEAHAPHRPRRPSCSAPRKGWRCSTARRCRPRSRWPACSAPRTCSPPALMAGALSLEAIQGSIKPFDARIHAARGQPGQIAVAGAVRALLEGSEIVPSHADCGRVQDPYSIRCVPQVMGACLDNLRACRARAAHRSQRRIRQPAGLRQRRRDLRRQLPRRAGRLRGRHHRAGRSAEIGAISERRMALLLDSGLSGLPPFLVRDGGVNSGFMIAQVTAAALASENKSLAHPASVDSLPTSANQEDHVSMATFAGAASGRHGREHGGRRRHRGDGRGARHRTQARPEELAAGRSRIRRHPRARRLHRPGPLPRPTSKPCASGRARASWPDAVQSILPSHA